jgi:hypothetical protein
MTYAEDAATTNDPGFRDRVFACATEQAKTFVNDARPEFYVLAQQVISSQMYATGLIPLVAAEPGVTPAVDDPGLLGAVQAVWPTYGATLVDVTTTEGSNDA